MNWQELKDACMNCEKCELYKTRTNVVFGAGQKNAEILFVGEGPGEQEDLTGEPFVGRAGQLLDKFLDYIGLERNTNVFIGNVVKCRPPQNRDPRPEETEVCIDWLREQVRQMRPKIIVCLGRISAQRLIAPNFKVTQEHGDFIEKGGILFMGTFHPAAILRDPRRKPEAFEDFLKLRDKIAQLGLSLEQPADTEE
ncbi:MAG: uracil-DNA glycosylase [Acutalibacteraceae bacterium]|jgi:uracil-DNA glycosylase family 4